MPSGCGSRTARSRSRRGSGARTRRSRRCQCALRTGTCTTWPACAPSGPISAGDADLLLVLGLGRLEQAPPGLHVRPALEQGPALALGHPTPDAELDPVVQGVGQALGADDTGHADLLGPVLLSSLDEQRIGVGCAACPSAGPVRSEAFGP